MPFRLATSLAALASSGSSAERNLLAQWSMGPSMVTSTVSLAFADSFWMSGGIGTSCACTIAAVANSGMSHNILVANFIAILIMIMDLLLDLPVLVFIRIHLVNFGLRQLQLASRNAQREHQALLGRFAFGAFAAHFVQVDSENHYCRERGQRRPADDRLSEDRLREQAQP